MNGAPPPLRVLDDAGLDLLELSISGWLPVSDLRDAIGPDDATLCDAEGTPIAALVGGGVTTLAPMGRGITAQWDPALRRTAAEVSAEVGPGSVVVFVHAGDDVAAHVPNASNVVFIVCTPRAGRAHDATSPTLLIERTRAHIQGLRDGGTTGAHLVVAPIDPRSTVQTRAAARAIGGSPIVPPLDRADPTASPRASHRGAVVMFTGLSGSGKSTIARALVEVMDERGYATDLLDGDAFRRRHTPNLGFDRASRIHNLASLGAIARESAVKGSVAVAAPIAPFEEARQAARIAVGSDVAFLLVYVSTPLEVCEARDRKGLYAKARRGEIEHFTGISSPFEPPDGADLEFDTSRVSVEDAVSEIMDVLLPRIALGSGRSG